MINFYCRFIPSAAKIMSPLFSALSGKANGKPLVWTDGMLTAFNEAKTALAEAALLTHPRKDTPTALVTDASDEAVGAVLQQHIHGEWLPLAFFSKQMRPPERKYSAFDKELLALYLGTRHFRYFLEGRVFTAYTDHKPLTLSNRPRGAGIPHCPVWPKAGRCPIREQGQYHLMRHLHGPTQACGARRVEKEGF